MITETIQPNTLGRPEQTQREQSTQTRNARPHQDIQIQLNVVSNTNVINNPFEPPIQADVNTEVLREGNDVEIFTNAILQPNEQEIRAYNLIEKIKEIKDHLMGAISFAILVYLFIKEQTRQP